MTIPFPSGVVRGRTRTLKLPADENGAGGVNRIPGAHDIRLDREARKTPQSLDPEEEARAQRAREAEARKQRMEALAEKAGFGDYSTDLMRQARGVDP